MKPLLIADLFCGAGGSSTGAERAVKALGGKMTLVCVNHWPVAIETHKLNHPTARHYIEDITKADPGDLVPEGYLDLLMASPECTHFSRVRGGKPVNNQSRMNPWVILTWLQKLDVRCLLIENVPEFRSWGPIDTNNQPVKEFKGIYFDLWLKEIKRLGYKLGYKLLNAADYGDATTRTRFFLIARKDGKKIKWPKPSHSATGEKLAKWRSAAEIIEWDNLGRSLLDDPKYLKTPLSINTRRRIARGLEKFGGELAPLYIQLLGLEASESNGGAATPFVMGKNGTNPAYSKTGKPIPTITTHRGISLASPCMVKYYGTGVAHSTDEPVPTVTTKDRVGLVQPFIVPQFGEADGQLSRLHSIKKPLPAVTSHGAGALVNPLLVEVNHSGDEDRSKSVEDPLNSVTSKRGTSLITPFMVQWDQTGGNGSTVRPVSAPLATIVTKQNTGIVEGLVEPILEKVESGEIDPKRLVIIDGEPYLLDIRFRMLMNLELARAMGFTDKESTYEFVGNASEVTKQIGNAVPVHMAQALVKAVLE